ncbi:molybdopterin-dependent oxidoreductase [Fodinisporobacter ferrooxydans]|uniref:Molybdopterin-dependent oxidoreductase n=1 Tax=Fodinisporobacter ferrooxydans TaxID=2901836 RepID=A0ABY4CK44_9BACL|nr:molybdopterin-dependent oxidoreductase [Alicyclobacillaceae bacterium MYW30-H2]
MKKKWFPHGKWPQFYVMLHYYTIVSFIGLLITGLALYLPFLHVALIRYLSILYDIHILLGILFFLSLFSPLILRLPRTKHIRIIDWFMPIAFGMAIVLAGMPLWQITWFSADWRETAFSWHGNLAYFLGFWFIVHGVFKAFGFKYPETQATKKMDPERRRFIKWGVTGLVGGVLAMTPFSQLFLQQGNRLGGTPGVNTSVATGVHDFPEYFTVTNSYPKVRIDKYQLQVDGLVAAPASLSFEQLAALPVTTETKDFQCVTGWAVPNVRWEGIHLKELVQLVKPAPDAAFVTFYSADGVYTESLTLQEALEADVLLAFKMDGQSLRVEQGYPLRLVVPRMYGYKSIKWVNRVEFARTRVQGYWEQRGYPAEAAF